MLACSFTLLSCGGGTYTEQVSVLYHAETQFVLDIDKEHLEQLISAMKIASAPLIINGRIAQVRPSNERNLNGCALSVQRKNGDLVLCFLHNNLVNCNDKCNILCDPSHLILRPTTITRREKRACLGEKQVVA